MPVPYLSRDAFVALPFDQQWFHLTKAFGDNDPLTLAKFDSLNESQRRYELYRILKGGGVGASQAFSGQPLEAYNGAIMPNNGYFETTFVIRPDQWAIGRAFEFGYYLDFELNNHPSAIETRIDIGNPAMAAINLITVSTTDFNNQPSNFQPITMKVDIRMIPFEGIGTANTKLNYTGTMIMTGEAHFQPPYIYSLNNTEQFIDSRIDNEIRFRVFNEDNMNALDTIRLFSAYSKF